MLVRLVLVPTADAVGPMVAGEAAGLVEEDREDIKLPLHPFLLETHKIYSSLRRAIGLGAGQGRHSPRSSKVT